MGFNMTPSYALSRAAAVAALLFPFAMSAHAGIVVFTDRSAFEGETIMQGTDDFDDLEATELEAQLSRSAGAYTYLITAGPGGGGFYPALWEGDTYLTATLANDTITFANFGPNIFAFGGSFFATDAYGAFSPGRSIALSATDGVATTNYLLDGARPSSFLGFVSTSPLTEVSLRTINEQGNVYWATANDIVLAMANPAPQPIPEPSSVATLFAGLGAAACVARRRRRRA